MAFFLHKDVRELVQSANKTEKTSWTGTGLFRVPDPQAGPLKTKTVIVKDLTYYETQLRAVQCVGATWIPEQIATFEDLNKASEKCTGGPCGSLEDCDSGSGCWWCDPFDGCVP